MTAFFSHRFSPHKVKVCRHCGRLFETETPAQKTCGDDGCVAWAKERKRQQNKISQQKWLARKRKSK